MLLKMGSRGQEVIELQQALEIKADGIFGEQTQTAVMAFQQENGLVVDGIAGPQTLSVLRPMNATTDFSEKVYLPLPGLAVHKYFLPADQYIPRPDTKRLPVFAPYSRVA